MLRLDGSVVRVTNARSLLALAERTVLATGVRSRTRGLLGRERLPRGEGLWLEPCSSIHMFFMRFAIDVAFVDRDGVVVRVCPDVRPWRVAVGGRRARAALELPVGVLEASHTRVGDRLRLDPA